MKKDIKLKLFLVPLISLALISLASWVIAATIVSPPEVPTTPNTCIAPPSKEVDVILTEPCNMSKEKGSTFVTLKWDLTAQVHKQFRDYPISCFVDRGGSLEHAVINWIEPNGVLGNVFYGNKSNVGPKGKFKITALAEGSSWRVICCIKSQENWQCAGDINVKGNQVSTNSMVLTQKKIDKCSADPEEQTIELNCGGTGEKILDSIVHKVTQTDGKNPPEGCMEYVCVDKVGWIINTQPSSGGPITENKGDANAACTINTKVKNGEVKQIGGVARKLIRNCVKIPIPFKF